MRVRAVGIIPALVGLLLVCSSVASADAGEWTSNGPSEPVASVTVDPSNPERVLAAGASGLWLSSDAGGSWTNTVQGPKFFDTFSIDPHAPDSVYAVAGDHNSIFKSPDAGSTWSTVLDAGRGLGSFNKVLADPNTSGRVFVTGTNAQGQDQLWRSTDAGQTWTPTFPPDSRGSGGVDTTALTGLASVVGVPGFVLAGASYYHSGGILATRDGGEHWSTIYDDALTYQESAYLIAVGGTGVSSTIYADFTVTEAGALIRSDDGASTWLNLTETLPITRCLPRCYGAPITALLADPDRPQDVYIAQRESGREHRTGVFVSTDAGQTWSELGHLDASVNGLALSPDTHTLHAATDSGVYEFVQDQSPAPDPTGESSD